MNPQSTEVPYKPKHVFIDPWREIALIAFIGMQLCWMVSWFRLITGTSQATSAIGAFLYFGGLLYASVQLARVKRRFSLKKNIGRFATGVLLIIILLIGIEILISSEDQFSLGSPQNQFNLVDSGIWIPAELIIVIIVFLLWRHGTNLAREWIGPLLVMRGFKVGLLLLLIYGILGLSLPTINLNLLLFTYFLASLAAMTTARIGGLSKVSGGQRISLDLQRFSGVFLAIAATVGIAMAAVALIGSRRTIIFLANLVSGLYLFLARLLVLILLPVYYLIIELIEGLFANLDPPAPEIPLTPTPTATPLPGGFAEDSPIQIQPGFFEQNPMLLNILIWTGLLAGLVVLLVFLRSRTRWADGYDFDDGEVDSIFDQGELLKRLRRALGRSREVVADRLSRLNILGRERAAARVRQIYDDLLSLSNRLGQPRMASMTPLEFLPLLEGLFPNHSTDVRMITDAYVRIRYGELPETRQEVDAVELAWKRVFEEGDSRLDVKQKR